MTVDIVLAQRLRTASGGPSGLPVLRSVASTPLADVDVDIEIDIADAGLRRLMRAALMPTALARACVADVRQLQAAPLWQRPRTLAAELPGQHDLFAALVGADDVRAQFADAAVIAAHDLLLAEDGVAEEGIGGAGHGLHAQDGSCFVPKAVPESWAGIGALDCVGCWISAHGKTKQADQPAGAVSEADLARALAHRGPRGLSVLSAFPGRRLRTGFRPANHHHRRRERSG